MSAAYFGDLARVHIRHGNLEKAAEHYEKAISLETDPERKARYGYELAQALNRAGQAKTALPHLQKAISLIGHSDQKLRCYRLLAEIAGNLNDSQTLQEALLRVERDSKRHAERSTARAKLVAFYRQAKDLDAIIAQHEAKLKADPKSETALAALSLIYSTVRKDAEKSLGVHEKLVALKPDDLILLSQLAQRYERAGRYEEAADALVKLAAASGVNIRSHHYRESANLYLRAQKPEKALVSLGQALESISNVSHRSRLTDQIVETAKKSGKVAEAMRGYGSRLEKEPENETLLTVLIALHADGQGDYKSAAALAERLCKLRPQDAAGLSKLAKLYRQSDQYDQAVGVYKRLLDIDKDPRQKASYLDQMVTGLIAAGRRDEAEQMLKHMTASATSEAGKLSAKRRLYLLYKETGKLDTVIAGLEARAKDDPRDEQSIRELRWIFTSVRPDSAKQLTLLEALKRLRPNDIAVLTELANRYQQARRFRQAAALFGDLAAADPETAWRHYRSLASSYAALGNADGQIEALRRAVGASADPTTRRASRRVLHDVCRRHGKIDWLIAEYRQQLETQPNDRETLQALGEALWEIKRDASGAVEVYEKLVSLSPGQPAALERLIGLYEATKQYAKAAARQEKLPGRSARVRDDNRLRVARLQVLAGNYAKGEEIYKSIMATGREAVTRAEARRALFSLYQKQNRLDDVIAAYSERVKKNPGDKDALEALAAIYNEVLGDPKAALGAYEKLAKLKPSDLNVLGTLSALYEGQGELAKATSTYLQAAEKANHPGTQTKYYRRVIGCYLRTEKKDELKGWLDELVKRPNVSPYVLANLAQSLHQQGQAPLAISVCDAVVAVSNRGNVSDYSLLQIGDVYRAAGRTEEARRLYKSLAEKGRSHTKIQAQKRLADLERAAKAAPAPVKPPAKSE